MTPQALNQIIHADGAGRKKNGNIVFRWGYFYRHGNSPEKYRDLVQMVLNQQHIDHEVVDFGDHWAPFSGGASLARSSHFYVEVKLL